MIKILAGILMTTGLVWNLFFHSNTDNNTSKVGLINHPTPSGTTQVLTKKKYVFVPYWGLGSNDNFSGYDEIIYFGITPNSAGISQDDGYKDINRFIKNSGNTKKLLSVVMTNTDIDEKVLQDKNLAQKIISQSIKIAKENGFSGIVLDFEISALGFQSVTDSITSFETNFANSVHKDNLLFYPAIYGDAYLRVRPFDIKSLGQISDGIFILAYDLHKANGDPGPNFPLDEKNDYSLKNAVSDFSRDVSSQKIIITFGMFGYDWNVDNSNQSTEEATALSLNDIYQKFFPVCNFKNCKITRDRDSGETEITYVDGQNQKHIVWFEDKSSVSSKEKYLKSVGIRSYAFWAYSYF